MRHRIPGLVALAAVLNFASASQTLAAERSVGEVKPASTYIEVVTIDPLTGFPVSGGGGGGTGGPTSIADGADLALGAKADLAWSGTGTGSLIAVSKSIRGLLAGGIPVTGTFWQATQPTSAADGSSVALGSVGATACATDNGSCAVTALIKRTNQRVTSLITAIGTPLQAGGNVAVTALPASAATATAQAAGNASLAALDADLGSSADPAYSGVGSSAMAYLRAIADSAISSGPAQTQLTASTAYFNASAGSTKYLVATGPQVLTDYFIENPDPTAKAYLQFFNAASTAAVTLGTTVPVRSIGLAGGEKANLSGLALDFPLGLVIAGTTTVSGSTAATTGLVVNLGYRGD